MRMHQKSVERGARYNMSEVNNPPDDNPPGQQPPGSQSSGSQPKKSPGDLISWPRTSEQENYRDARLEEQQKRDYPEDFFRPRPPAPLEDPPMTWSKRLLYQIPYLLSLQLFFLSLFFTLKGDWEFAFWFLCSAITAFIIGGISYTNINRRR